MARKITELTAAGAVTPATDLLWIEQAGEPRKITLASMGVPAVGTTVDSTVRWNGTAYVENTNVKTTVASLTVENATQDAVLFLKADTSNTVETATPWIRFEADGGNTNAIIGISGPEDVDGQGNTFLGAVVNGLSIHSRWSGTIAIGVNGQAGIKIDDNDDLTVTNDVIAGGQVSAVPLGSTAGFTIPGSGSGVRMGSYASLSRTYSNAHTVLGNNIYVDPADAVSGQVRTAVTHASYGHTIYEQAAGVHYWYGASGSVTADAVVTKSQLGSWDANGFRISQLGTTGGISADSLSLGGYGLLGNRSAPIYLTNTGTGGVQINAGGVHGSAQKVASFNTTQVQITPPSAAAGTAALFVRNNGTANKIARFQGDTDALDIETIDAGDYKIRNSARDNSIVFYDGDGGVDIFYDGSRRLRCDVGNDVALYFAGIEEFHTQDSNAAGNSTGAEIKHFNGTYYDVGMNQMPRLVSNANITLTDEHCGGYFYSNNATTYTITLNNSAGGGADFPIGGMFFILNYGSSGTSGNVVVDTGSGTLYNPGPLGATTGSRTVGPGVATILKYAADVWFIWGDSIT